MKMKKMLRMLLGSMTCGLLLAAAAMTAAAATPISSVGLDIVPYDALANVGPGSVIEGTGADARIVAGSGFWITSAEISGNTGTIKDSYAYTIYLEAMDGYYFTNDTVVSVHGAYEVDTTLRTMQSLRVRAKTYPYYVMSPVSGIVINTESKRAVWTPVSGARGYSAYIFFTDRYGTEHSVQRSTSKAELSLSSYIGTGAQYENIDVSVKALKGTSMADHFAAESEYVFSSGGVDYEHSSDDYVFNSIPTASKKAGGGAVASATTTGTGTATGTSQPSSGGPGAAAQPSGANGWQGGGDVWSYFVNGNRAIGWLALSDTEWYFFDSNGLMKAGWLSDGGCIYLLNVNHDGSYGKMLTGLQNVNGSWYYFNEAHDGTYGAMYVNRYLPNSSLYAGADGIVR